MDAFGKLGERHVKRVARVKEIGYTFQCLSNFSSASITEWSTPNMLLSPFSTRRLFSREATFSFVGVAYHISKCDADKGKSRFARKKSPSGKRALASQSVSQPVSQPASQPVFSTAFVDFRRPLEKDGFWTAVYYVSSSFCSSVVEHWSSNPEDAGSSPSRETSELHFSQLVPVWVL